MSDFSFYAQSIDDATLTLNTLDEATGYPKENLQDRNKNTVWKCDTANISGYIQIDLVTARACDFLILGSHNYTDTNYGIKLAYDSADDPGFAGITYSIGSAIAYHDYQAADETNWIQIIQSRSKRYWRLYLEAMGAATNQQIGTIFLGTAFDLAKNPELISDISSGYDVSINQAAGGTRYGQIANTTVRRHWEYDWSYITESEKTKYETWRDLIFMGDKFSLHPFYFTDDNGTTLKYARTIGRLKFGEMAYQAYKTRIILEEEL